MNQKILTVALVGLLVSGRLEGKAASRDVTTYSSLFGGLTNSNEVSVHVGAGEVLALKVTKADIATMGGHTGGFQATNTYAMGGVDMCLSLTPGEFDGNPHHQATNVTNAALTSFPPNAGTGFHDADVFYCNVRWHDPKHAGDMHLQNHGAGAAAVAKK